MSWFRRDGPCAGSAGMVAGEEEEEDRGSSIPLVAPFKH